MFKRIIPVTNSILSKRNLNLQEYHSKDLLEQGGLNVQKFFVAENSADAKVSAQKLLDNGAKELVIKAQILAGGRGKGTFSPSGYKGGVKLTEKPDEVGEIVGNMLGQNLVTKQTSKDGVKVSKVMVAHALDIQKETYVAILMDRDHNGPVIVASPAGGMDIEKVAEETPEKIHTLPVNIFEGITVEQAQSLTSKLELPEHLITEAAKQIVKLYELFIKVDATQIEINPFGVTTENEIVCFDAKINFDDCAEFRQKSIFALNDTSESDPKEIEAEKHGLNYISLDGNIACLVNGAGLAMGTMDILKLHGGEPANFLDLGGGITEAGVLKAFEIIKSDDKVKAIFVNIFGGIVDCGLVARGLVNAYSKLDIQVPLIARLEGTNVDIGRKVIEDSGLNIIASKSFDEGARLAVQSVSN